MQLRLWLRLRLLCVIVLQSDCLRQFDGEAGLLQQLHFCCSQTANADFEIVERSKCAVAVTFGWTATETDRELRVSAVPCDGTNTDSLPSPCLPPLFTHPRSCLPVCLSWAAPLECDRGRHD